LAKWSLGRFLNDPALILHFYFYLPFEEDLPLYSNKLEFSSPKDDFVRSLIEIGLLVLNKIFFRNAVYFYFSLLSSLEKDVPPLSEET
jgi:hypothetical protein